MTKQLNDRLDDLIGAEKRDEPRTPPASYARVQASYNEPCKKCRGTGMTRWGRCFGCDGVGSKTFSTSPEARAKARTQNVERKANVATDALASFEAQHPQVWAWIKANAGKFDFAAKMVETIVRYGSLTDGQLAACERCVDREAARTAERAQRVQQAPAVDTAGVDRLKVAFDKAIAYSLAKGRTLTQPRITIGGIVISPAKANSKNPGALYVKERGEYLGKIKDGRFHGFNCPAPTAEKIMAFIADPKAAAEAYGIETGTCCICNATLTNKESIERGIGPICAEKFGW